MQRQIQSRIDSLSYLPTTAAVAMKFVELGKNPDADPTDYAKVISADSSLSSKLLALANSSWAGVRNKVTNVQMAVNLLGLGTVRTLAISYCMTGLHNELRLSPRESQMFWQASLCKAVAAQSYARLFDTKLADEAFVAGLFQDFALTVMYATAKEPYLAVLQAPETPTRVQLQKERELFGLDHAEVGRLLAQKLQLPDLFVDVVGFHHDYEELTGFVENEAFRGAAYTASLFPHLLNVWDRADIDALSAFTQEHAPSVELQAFLAEVQKEFTKLYTFFHEGDVPEAQLEELLARTAREAADNTTDLVNNMNEFMHQAATAGVQMNKVVNTLEREAVRDRLTGVLNRQGFAEQAQERLAKAARNGTSFALAYLDIDEFKGVNDKFGHAFGDTALAATVCAAAAGLPRDALIGRVGGDEFVALLSECTEQEAKKLALRIVSSVSDKPISHGDQSAQITVSVGLLYVSPSTDPPQLDALVSAADKLMYQAKRARGNRAEFGAI
jgi:diguanylate cyclase (GGDEF)-like protein